MGTVERKIKEREALRNKILEAAMLLFVHKGIEQTTMRNIAEAIDYSVGTLYAHFQDKDSILHALHTQGFIALAEYLARTSDKDEPMLRLKELGKQYLAFALEQPKMYHLMLISSAPMAWMEKADEHTWHEGKAAFGMLTQSIRACMEEGYFVGHEVHALSYLMWSMVHGLASLHIAGRVEGLELPLESSLLLHHAYQSFERMLDLV